MKVIGPQRDELGEGTIRVKDTNEIRVERVEKKLAQYKQIWSNHVSRMEDIRHPITSP
jgi:hypothetical protein